MTRSAILAAVLALAVVAGCAPLPPPMTTPARPAPTTPGTGAPRPGTPAPSRPAAAVIDSTPSADALAVLGSIPDPIPDAQRVAPPDLPPDTTGGAGTPSVPAANDDSEAGTGSNVPIPSPTPVLGERTNPLLEAPPDTAAGDAPDSTSSARSRPPASSPPSGSGAPPPTSPAPPSPSPAPPAATGRGGTCWRIQVAAPTARDEAERKRAAAESQLVIPMVIEPEKSLFKVRSRDCYERDVADRLRDRAVGSGFDGAFALGVPRR